MAFDSVRLSMDSKTILLVNNLEKVLLLLVFPKFNRKLSKSSMHEKLLGIQFGDTTVTFLH